MATKLDDLVGMKQAKDMEEIDIEVAKFKRIVIQIQSDTGENCIARSLKPARYYSDLQSFVETLHPGFTCILSVPNTKEIVGSQFELLCAYQDCPKDILTLNLNLHPSETTKRKRPIDESYETVAQDVFIQHTGRWLNSEIELFHQGVIQYGWGEWAKIADYIQTRDRIQVCKFSLNQRAKKYKTSKTVVPVLSDLAEGLKTVAATLAAAQNDET